MKNSRLFPFERNRYFYGKLFTVRDFETEQRYFNDKRRMLNKFVVGSGIVSGLQVVAIDEKTVSIEPGIAIDSLGREIVVPFPITQKLSLVEGFPNNEYSNNIYLCIAYDEKGKELVHSVSGSTEESGDVNEYNRINESYKIFIKEEAPDTTAGGLSGLIENTSLIYNDNKVKIWQITPKYVTDSGKFDIVIKIEKIMQVNDIEFSYELCLENITGLDGKDSIRVSFNEADHCASGQYTVKYSARVKDTADKSGKVFLKGDSFNIKIGDMLSRVSTQFINEVRIIPESVKAEIVKGYFCKGLDEHMNNAAETCIHLAKISLIKVSSVFVIEKVLPVPFDEYIYSIPLLSKLVMTYEQGRDDIFTARASAAYISSKEQPSAEVVYDDNKKEFDFKFKLPECRIENNTSISTGIVDITADGKFKASKSYFSEEIEHKLGAGPVAVVLGLEEQEEDADTLALQSNKCIYYGSYDIFEKSPYEASKPQVSMASVVYPQKGTFRVGIKLENPTNESHIRIRWLVYKVSNT
ncbi:MAG: hypothetical protein ACOZCL_06465 [Bacillota bacterium]